MARHVVEDYLAALYVLTADRRPVISARLGEYLAVSPPTVAETLKRLQADGYIVFGPRREIILTPAGRAVGEAVVRRHCLIERWLTDLLGLDWVAAHEEADHLEHLLTPRLEERLFGLLGQPTTCPHGNPIPGRGRPLAWATVPLDRVPEGQEVVIDRITEEAERDTALLAALWQAGLGPGVRVRVGATVPTADQVTLERDGQRITLPAAGLSGVRVRPADLAPQVLDLVGSPRPETFPPVRVTVVGVQGHCQAHHQRGERFAISACTPGGLCAEAFVALFPRVREMQRRLVAGEEPPAVEVACPEDGNVLFRVEPPAASE
jgi:DtxR family Mn-dependent transcriptional regulator